MAQLNFSRRLAGDAALGSWMPKLLTSGDDATCITWKQKVKRTMPCPRHLKERLGGRGQPPAETGRGPKLQIDDSGKNVTKTTELPEDILAKTGNKPLITDENNDARTLFTDDKSKTAWIRPSVFH